MDAAGTQPIGARTILKYMRHKDIIEASYAFAHGYMMNIKNTEVKNAFIFCFE